jgi:peptidoglycan/LPS O-acetylase OafA/YrhL
MVKNLIIAYLLVLATVLTFFLCHYLSYKVVEDWRLSRFFLVNIVTKDLECFGSRCPNIPRRKTTNPLETPFEKKVKSL